jgi:sensor histidine kinase regulating citrate/malate metabolism
MRHEMRQILTANLGLLENNKADEAAKNIRKTLSLNNAHVSIIDMGYPAVDSILGSIIKKACDQGIKIKHKILIDRELNIDQFDLALLLANALENALEAVTKSKGIDKDIHLRIAEKPGYLTIRVINHTSEPVDMDLRTTKADKVNHGFGIRNMKDIIAKYDGNLEIKFDQKIGKFTLSMLLKIQNS